jgi:hypothetical protein
MESASVSKEPLQLDLFVSPGQSRLFGDVQSLVDAALEAVEAGHAIALMRSPRGFELLVGQRQEEPATSSLDFGDDTVVGARCGFTRRATEALLGAIERGTRALWARSAGGAWNGWIEWGRISVPSG